VEALWKKPLRHPKATDALNEKFSVQPKVLAALSIKPQN